ncbi:MAG: substrate-binding domain-containing protein [Nitriliruptorales bacterium]|nr:substrate-binding domain-containing protein [Nitriliruptorales bacterium]
MFTTRKRRLLFAVLAVLSLVLAACGDGDGETDTGTDTDTETDAPTDTESPTGGEATGDPVQVAVVTSTSGPLASYGNQYVEGFEVGLDYATDGTGVVNGECPVEVTYLDDTGDPAQATSIVTEQIGEGTTIIAGTVVSGVALQVGPLAAQNNILYISGPAAADAITGLNRNTFRSGRQTYQDVMTAANFLDSVEGQTVTVFAQDTAFGQANVAGVDAILGGAGATVDSILVPAETTDFTPFARRVTDNPPDLLFVAWAGETASSMWQALDQQGVFDATTVVTGLDQRASWETTFGGVSGQIDFLAHYFAEAPDNEVNQYLADNLDGTPDLFTPDGFVGAQMVVRAISEVGCDATDIEGMISALEGWTFDAPKGQQTVRAEDHAMLQPMFQASLEQQDGEVVATPVDTLDPETVAPPTGSFEDEG